MTYFIGLLIFLSGDHHLLRRKRNGHIGGIQPFERLDSDCGRHRVVARVVGPEADLRIDHPMRQSTPMARGALASRLFVAL